MTGPMLIITATTTAAADRLALGVLSSRMLEDTEIVIGVVSLLAMVTLRQDIAGVNVVEQALAGARDWNLLNGPTSARCHPTGRFGVPITDRSITMSTRNSSTSSRAQRIRSAVGIAALVAVLATMLAACSAAGDAVDDRQREQTSEVEPDENENERDEYENERDENERDENENEPGENENEKDENEADENEADENDEGDEGDEGEEDENEADENEEGDDD